MPPRDPHDHYVDEPWCSQRLFEAVRFEGRTVDPSAGWGRIVRAGTAAGINMLGFDINEHARPDSEPAFRMGIPFTKDFMADHWWSGGEVNNIVTNPPFGLCDVRKMRRAGRKTYAALALERARSKVALLLPATWHLGDETSRWLEKTPLLGIWFLTPRPSMPPGAHIIAGGRVGNGTVDFAWYVWLHGYDGPVRLSYLRRDP